MKKPEAARCAKCGVAETIPCHGTSVCRQCHTEAAGEALTFETLWKEVVKQNAALREALKKAEDLIADPENWYEMSDHLSELAAKLKKAEEERWKDVELCGALGERLDTAATQRDAAEARVKALEKIVEKAPHGDGCRLFSWNTHAGAPRLPCDCWKAAALKGEEGKP